MLLIAIRHKLIAIVVKHVDIMLVYETQLHSCMQAREWQDLVYLRTTAASYNYSFTKLINMHFTGCCINGADLKFYFRSANDISVHGL